jgi:RimJ/RimL family protein N-acetyltransferase
MAGDDSSPPVEEYQPDQNPVIWYVLCWSGETFYGLLTFAPVNAITYQVHCCLLPESFGRTAEVLRAGFRWFWRQSGSQRVEARIPSFNRLALRLANKAGMMEMCEMKRSFLKHGKRWDEVLLAIDRPEE